MKFLIAVVLLAALASAEYKVKTREDLMTFRDDCVKQLGTPPAELEKYKKWNFPDDDTAHAYMNCILTKFGLFDSEKGFNVEDIHTQMVGGSHADHSDETHAKIEKCATEANAAEPSVRAYRGAMCFIRENLQLVQKSVHAHDHDHSKH